MNYYTEVKVAFLTTSYSNTVDLLSDIKLFLKEMRPCYCDCDVRNEGGNNTLRRVSRLVEKTAK